MVEASSEIHNAYDMEEPFMEQIHQFHSSILVVVAVQKNTRKVILFQG